MGKWLKSKGKLFMVESSLKVWEIGSCLTVMEIHLKVRESCLIVWEIGLNVKERDLWLKAI